MLLCVDEVETAFNALNTCVQSINSMLDSDEISTEPCNLIFDRVDPVRKRVDFRLNAIKPAIDASQEL